jgi:hypothetical protein
MLKKMLLEDGLPVDARKLPGGERASALTKPNDALAEEITRTAAMVPRQGRSASHGPLDRRSLN